MNNTLQATLNNAIGHGPGLGWVVQDCAITRKKAQNIMTDKKVDFSKIDFSKVDFGSLSVQWLAELGQVGVLKLSTRINSKWRIVATRTNDETWKVHFDVCVETTVLRDTLTACDIVDAFIVSQPEKTWKVKTPFEHEWVTTQCAAGFQRLVLVDKITGKRNKVEEYCVKVARALLEKHGSKLVDQRGDMVISFNVHCEEV